MFVKNNQKGYILDVGGGVGVISIVLSKVLECNSDMVEINQRALDLAFKNIKLNGVSNSVKAMYSDAYENVEQYYDFVVTNPPIRAGKKVVYSILFGAFNHLKEDGELWFVMRKNHGADSAMKDLKEKDIICEVVKKDKGFFIIKAKKVRN